MIAIDLHTSRALINLTVTLYMNVSGIAPSLAGDASDTFGRLPVYIFTDALSCCPSWDSTSTLLRGSFLTSYATECRNIWWGVVCAEVYKKRKLNINPGTFPVAYGVIADIAAPSERGAFIGAVSFG